MEGSRKGSVNRIRSGTNSVSAGRKSEDIKLCIVNECFYTMRYDDITKAAKQSMTSCALVINPARQTLK